jgi:hypothetical protein
MLVPLTRETFEQVIPLIATGAQYKFAWGQSKDLLSRLLISLLIVVSIWLVGLVFGSGAEGLQLICFIIGGLYWFWSPIYVASVQNNAYRRFPYAGFWRGRVLDVYITEKVVREDQQADRFGRLEIIENFEKRINIEVGDREGFRVTVQAPVKRLYKPIAPGQVAELLVLSKQPELERIDKITDLYLPQFDLWVGDYPYLRRDLFKDISAKLGQNRQDAPTRRPNRRRLR